jgi:hypothetical protein
MPDQRPTSDTIPGEGEALALLKRRDLNPADLERLSKNRAVMKSRKVKLAVAQHPKTPRHVCAALLRHLFTLELMKVTLDASTPAEVKKFAEQTLIGRMEGISLGEKLTLARRASGAVADELMGDAEPRVVRIALENSRVTEAAVVKAIQRADASAALVAEVCSHPKWSLRREVRIALLRNENTPLARALEFARGLPPGLVADVLSSSNLQEKVKTALLEGSRR